MINELKLIIDRLKIDNVDYRSVNCHHGEKSSLNFDLDILNYAFGSLTFWSSGEAHMIILGWNIGNYIADEHYSDLDLESAIDVLSLFVSKLIRHENGDKKTV